MSDAKPKPYTTEELDSPGWWAPGRVRATVLALGEARKALWRIVGQSANGCQQCFDANATALGALEEADDEQT